jgi:translation initiation factor 1
VSVAREEKDDEMPKDSNSRLAYSTGGEREPKAQREPAAAVTAGGIRILLDRRASGRVVTVVTGLPGSAARAAELARALKSACGTGGTVKDGRLELQGDHRDAVEIALTAQGLRSKRSGG